LPRDGYTALVRAILDHPAIRVTTGIAFSRDMLRDCDFCFTSMAIDEYFDGALGPLPYRSIRFHHRREPMDYRLGETMQVNFTDTGPYIRQDDWSRLPGHVVHPGVAKTVTLEEPCADTDNGMERYYPVKTARAWRGLRYQDSRRLKVQFIGAAAPIAISIRTSHQPVAPGRCPLVPTAPRPAAAHHEVEFVIADRRGSPYPVGANTARRATDLLLHQTGRPIRFPGAAGDCRSEMAWPTSCSTRTTSGGARLCPMPTTISWRREDPRLLDCATVNAALPAGADRGIRFQL
jgi:hypothetical protein